MPEESFSREQLDLLRELGTVGSGRAATSLAELLRVRVEITVPKAELIPLEKIGKILEGEGIDNTFFVLENQLEGEVAGTIFLLFSPADARLIASLLLGEKPEKINIEDDLFISALKECANILVGSYVIALTEMTDLRAMSTVPNIAVDMLGAVIDFMFVKIADDCEEALFINTSLKIKDQDMAGVFLFFPDRESLKKIFATFGGI